MLVCALFFPRLAVALRLMISRPVLLLSTFVAGFAAADGPVLHRLDFLADVPAVRVSPQAPGRHFFTLPTLEYAFQLEARCDVGWKPESLSLNVADSRASVGSAALNENPGQEIRLRIPAAQLAPIVLREFCVIDGTEEGSGDGGEAVASTPAGLSQMTYRAALSAQASLRCSNGSDEQVVYVSKPLDLALACDTPSPPGAR